MTATATGAKTSTPTSTPTLVPTLSATPDPSGGGCGTSAVSLLLKEITSCSQANQPSQNFEVINSGSTALNMNQITVKFWIDDTNFTANSANTVVGAVNFGGNFGPNNSQTANGVALNPVNFSPACGPDGTHQGNWELTLSNTDTRILSAVTTCSNIQTALHVGSSFVNFVPGSADWYSPCGVGSTGNYGTDVHYAIYYQGNLVTASWEWMPPPPPSCRALPTCTPVGGATWRW